MDMTVARLRRPSSSTPTMSALPRSIASRLLAPALRPSVPRAIAPRYRTYSSNEPENKTSSEDAPAVPVTSDSTQIREEGAAEGMRHQPDYNVAVDYRTSCAQTGPNRMVCWLTSVQQLLSCPQACHGWKRAW